MSRFNLTAWWKAISKFQKVKSKKPVNFTRWISILLALLVGLNIIFFIAYYDSHPSEDIWLKLWSYFESETFRALMVSLAFPVVILVIESQFKIIEHIFENRLEQAKREFEEQVEARRKIEEDRKEKRLQAIGMTSETFRQINNLVSEVRVYDDQSKASMNNIIGRIASQSIAVSELINTWIVRFPILPTNVHSLFRGYVIVLYWGAWAVAHCIQKGIGGDKEELQESLAMIQRGIVGIAFGPIFNALTSSMSLMESIEELHKNMEDDENSSDKKLNEIKTKVKDSESRHDQIINIIKKTFEDDLKNCFAEKGVLYNIVKEELGDGSTHSEFMPIKPMTAIWLSCKQSVEKEIISKIYDTALKNVKVKEYARKKMEDEIKELTLNIFQLKVYDIILRLDEFRNEEILPSVDSSCNCNKGQEVRATYQAIKRYMKDPEVVKVGSAKFDSFFTSKEYQEFRQYYFGIKDTDLINIVAVDTIQRIKKMGILIRFGSVLPFDQGLGAVQ